jgi:hypothetical protein
MKETKGQKKARLERQAVDAALETMKDALYRKDGVRPHSLYAILDAVLRDEMESLATGYMLMERVAGRIDAVVQQLEHDEDDGEEEEAQ